jgi:hypothetical protein
MANLAHVAEEDKTYIQRSECKVPDAALKKNFRLLKDFFRCTSKTLLDKP